MSCQCHQGHQLKWTKSLRDWCVIQTPCETRLKYVSERFSGEEQEFQPYLVLEFDVNSIFYRQTNSRQKSFGWGFFLGQSINEPHCDDLNLKKQHKGGERQRRHFNSKQTRQASMFCKSWSENCSNEFTSGCAAISTGEAYTNTPAEYSF